MSSADYDYDPLVPSDNVYYPASTVFPPGADRDGFSYQRFEKEFVIKNATGMGSGAFGTIVKVVHRPSNQEFALKMIDDPLFDEELSAHMCKERSALVSLNRPGHPFIIKLFACTTSPNNQEYFILELAPNRDLNFWIHYKFRGIDALHINCVRFYTAEVVLALEYLRSKSIVHRNIKAENVLLDSNFHIKLCDFGCAKRINDSRQALNIKFLRKKNKKIGNLLFIAPECWFKEELTYSTDLWNLGYLIFDMYAGGPICIDKNEPTQRRYERIQRGEYMWPHDGAREDVVHIVQKLTRRQPENRIGAHDLQQLKDHDFFRHTRFEGLQFQPAPPMEPSNELPERQLVVKRQDAVHALPHVIAGEEPEEGPEGAGGGASAIPQHLASLGEERPDSPPVNLLDMPIPEFKDPTLPPPMM